ncbi:MAG: putative zinc-binding metallopeptidase [Ignavibacteria bacterium]
MENKDLLHLNYNQIAGLKLKDLRLSISGSILEDRIKKLLNELEYKGLQFRPHIWISEGWFTPDDIPGFGVPFYLLHKKLIKLEKREMFEAEGEGISECMKILRHETGHAISHAYYLYKNREWKDIFGKYNARYPVYYTPNPGSRNFVEHLNAWYAQAHPVEDFAETFAVWLNPKSNWKKKYSGWGALNKLKYVDQVMNNLKTKPQLNNSTDTLDELKELNNTIKNYYKRKKKFYTIKWPETYDKDLKKIFISNGSGEPASLFMKKRRAKIRNKIAEVLDVPAYTIDQLILNMIKRCKELNYKNVTDQDETEKRLLIILAAQLNNYIHSGYFKIPL